ncbi:protein-L-isoaspartate O-methyltransferase family protein [Sulfurivermis fontis]|uniref:protein-L-isoaspartate O-methyltransferase family protein n=1 Tax=Sulfurivermis fontis TaxID=1972068 RepID=UPI000FD9C124|nr:protein-L-isoaspartate O-methyltransferase [Sulfurivermis fontis]
MNLEQARHNMIAQQIRPWEVVDDQVLDLIMRTPREDFVPPPYRNLAFTDIALPLGHGQVMMPPRLEARLLQALAVQPDESVLEIGTGSGYVTALLAQLARHVYSVEIVPQLKQAAEQRLAARGLTNVTVDEGDAAAGWPRRGSYDVIAVTGSLPELPQALQQELNIGGRLFVVVGEAPAMEALLITRVGENHWTRESLFETELPPLQNAPRPPRFVL